MQSRYLDTSGWFIQKYTYICWIHTDAIIIKTPDDNDTGTNDARKKEDAGRLLYKIFYLTSLFVSFERVVPSLRVRESWRPNITEIFWPRSYGRQRCVFLVLHGCSTGPWSKLFCVLAFPTTIASTSVFHCTACPPSRLSPTVLNSSALYYLQTPTPAQPLPISSDRDVSLPSGAPPWMAFLAGSKGQNITRRLQKWLGSRWHSSKKECLRCQAINLAPPGSRIPVKVFLDRLLLKPGHTRPDPCTGQRGQPKGMSAELFPESSAYALLCWEEISVSVK